MPRLRTVSRQSRISIAITVVATVAKLANSEAAVSVTTDWEPLTSLPTPARRPRGPRWGYCPIGLGRQGGRVGGQAQRHPLQMAVEGEPQVVHHALPDHVGEVRLPDPEEARHERQHPHPPGLY